MLFSPRNLLAVATCLLFTGLAAAQDPECSGGPWEDVMVIGGGGGSSYCATKWKEGTVMNGVEAWANSKGVQAIQFYYSDGTSSPLMGTINGETHNRLDWSPATDTISQVRTWGNGNGKYLGRVYIRTQTGLTFDVGKDTNGQETFESTVASGIMLGAFGTSGKMVDSLGFLFLKGKVDKITVDDIVFDQTPEELNARAIQDELDIVTLDHADFRNDSPDANETFAFGRSDVRTVSKTFTTTSTDSFGVSEAIEISGEILDLGASSTTTLEYGYSKAKTEESTKATTVTLTYTVSGVLKPGQRVFCYASAMSGTYKGEYSANVNIHLEDKTTFGFAKRGTLEQVSWSQASSSCQDEPFANIPSKKRATKFIA